MVDIYRLDPEAGQPDLQLAQGLKMLRDSYVFLRFIIQDIVQILFPRNKDK
jgi:hypothetical protein